MPLQETGFTFCFDGGSTLRSPRQTPTVIPPTDREMSLKLNTAVISWWLSTFIEENA